ATPHPPSVAPPAPPQALSIHVAAARPASLHPPHPTSPPPGTPVSPAPGAPAVASPAGAPTAAPSYQGTRRTSGPRVPILDPWGEEPTIPKIRVEAVQVEGDAVVLQR